jgi:15-cis-phytoene synthase
MTDATIPSELRPAYACCRHLTRSHGTTYFWATQLLPARCRPHVYALYGFCRHADDTVDDIYERPVTDRANALGRLGDSLRQAMSGGAPDPAPDPVVAAAAHTATTYRIELDCFERFLAAMAMDLTAATYPTWDSLLDYMDGSAAAIGEMMLPILEPLDMAATEPARALGLAFQLTNFLRDVGEDLDRGRVYLPQDDLDRFGAEPATRHVTDAWRNLMRHEIRRARELYDRADDGIAALPAWSARSITAARVLYASILDEIEANDYDVFTQRARVSTGRKLLITARHALPIATGTRRL